MYFAAKACNHPGWNFRHNLKYGRHRLSRGRCKADSHIACRAHAFPLPCRAAKGLECLSHLIYTVRPCLIHTRHAAPMPCSDHAVLFKATAQHCRREAAVLCCGLEKNGMVGAWHRRGMASVNQTRPQCVNQIGKTHCKPVAPRHGMGTACYVWIGL